MNNIYKVCYKIFIELHLLVNAGLILGIIVNDNKNSISIMSNRKLMPIENNYISYVVSKYGRNKITYESIIIEDG